MEKMPWHQVLDDWKDRAIGEWGVWIEDLETGKSWSWNANILFNAASLIKVPIMMAIYRENHLGKLSLSERIPLRAEDQVGGNGVLQHLQPGLSLSIQDLITLMIIQSDNTATNMLIDRVGKNAIRETMAQVGMKNSCFYNRLMIMPANPEGVNQVTAEDMATCFRIIAQGKAFSHHASQEMIRILKKQQINDTFPYLLPNANQPFVGGIPTWEMAHKTGLIHEHLHDSGVLYIGSRAIIMVALSRGISFHDSQRQMAELALLTFQHSLV